MVIGMIGTVVLSAGVVAVAGVVEPSAGASMISAAGALMTSAVGASMTLAVEALITSVVSLKIQLS
jgi:hypothetical protein